MPTGARRMIVGMCGAMTAEPMVGPALERESRVANFDKAKFVAYLKTHISAKPFGEGACALHVRLALAAGGLKPISWP